MGCGCRGGGRSPRPAIGPMSSRNTNSVRLKANSAPQTPNLGVSGMTKQQRDAERKRRIQAIIAKKSGS